MKAEYYYLERKTDLKILNVGAALGASTMMLKQFGEVTSFEYDNGYLQ